MAVMLRLQFSAKVKENKTSKKHQYKVWPLIKHMQLQIGLSYCNFVTSLLGFNLHCVKYSLLQNILLGSGLVLFFLKLIVFHTVCLIINFSLSIMSKKNYQFHEHCLKVNFMGISFTVTNQQSTKDYGRPTRQAK